jgi:hypothetical protein
MWFSAGIAGGRTIASNNEELIVLVDVVYLDVGERGDYLLLGRKVGTLLEFEVAYRTRQGEVAVHAAEIDEATCGLDTSFLGFALSAEATDIEQSSHLHSGVCGQTTTASLGP